MFPKRPVSYTHLDVYKRQRYDSPNRYAVGRIERTMSEGTTLVEQTLYPEDYDLSGGVTLAELSLIHI